VLGTLSMSSGRHYWEIRLDKFVDEEDLFLGIARFFIIYIYKYLYIKKSRKEIDLYS
jgi:hypothetical protein